MTRARKSLGEARGAGLAFRLPQWVRPAAYRVFVDVDPQRSDRYEGRVEIDVTLARATRVIELHAAELEVTSAQCTGEGGVVHEAQIAMHPERETVQLRMAARLRAGAATLRLGFAATLRGDLRGFYAAAAGPHRYAFTQLEAADARRFFPCFDEPAWKARFRLEVETAAEHTVISNTRIAEITQVAPGRQRVRFEPTEPLSSYLVALAVGALSISEPVFAGEVPIRVVHVPGNERLTAFALQTARECLLRLSRYFALPYPYGKLDLVAAPDFEIGAMENAGAVFFRETLLLVDEDSVSLAEKKRAAEVICHELAHMWYGNLVTMRWWDDLWLNEAFATFMAFDVVARWRPEWKMWNDFGHSRATALELDALDNTHAIYARVRTPADASENFDAITYEKGAAVVRMLERYLGERTFQTGVRSYLRRHAGGNAVAKDLWRALGEASGTDVERLVQAWVTTAGFPLVRVSLRARGEHDELVVAQEQFSARGRARAAARWNVPLVVRAFGARRVREVRLLLTRRAQAVALPERGTTFVYGNADEGGFYHPLHDAACFEALLAGLPLLSPSERLGLVGHRWALVRAGYARLPTFLALTAALSQETDADVLLALVEPLTHLLRDAPDAELRRALRRWLAGRFEPALRALGLAPAPGEPDERRLLRAALLVLAGVLAEAPAVVAAAEQAVARYGSADLRLDANLIAPLLTIGARGATATRYESYVDGSQRAQTPQERRRFRMALADVRDPRLIDRTLSLCLTDHVPTQDVTLLLARLLLNDAARERTWAFAKTHWAALQRRMPAMLVSRFIGATPCLGTQRHRRDVARFFAEHPVPTAARALRQADERFRLDAALRKRTAPALRRYFG